MASVYARVSKITKASGRANYLTDEKRQEEIVLSKIEMEYSWQEHSNFEECHQKTNVKNNEALEVHFALPNELSKDKKRLEQICDDMADRVVGENKDYQYAVHWNHNRTNLHCHILFSERENQQDLVPKVYKKDQWRDKDTNKLAKANSENAYLYAKKGDIQKDKNGNIKYETDIFTVKDKRYVARDYSQTLRNELQGVLQSYGYDLSITDDRSPYIAQKKLYKGASADYIEKAKEWNKEVKAYNQAVKKHIKMEPIQEENYIEIKREIKRKCKSANAEEKKITTKAIELIKNLREWLVNQITQLWIVYLNREEEKKRERWEDEKEELWEIFEEYTENEREVMELDIQDKQLKELEMSLGNIIEKKEEMIDEIEQERRWNERDYGWGR